VISKELNIIIENVSKKYFNKLGISNISTTFEAGYLNLLVGPNGSGKSTLLKCIMGLIKYDGIIKKNTYKIGYAPEEYVMPSFMTIQDFLVSIGRVKNLEIVYLKETMKKYLLIFDLLQEESRLIGKLSNGMKQKVNLMQAFIHQPRIILLDEPLVSLDLVSQEKILSMIKERCKDSLIIISTHQPEKFKVRKKRIYHIENGCLKDEFIN